MDHQSILVSHQAGVTQIALNRPQVMNALISTICMIICAIRALPRRWKA